MDTKKIGAFLKQCRKEKNLTQEQLAEKFEVSARTVSRWETGINMPDLSILVQLAEYYDVEMRELLDGERSQTMNKEMKETLDKVAVYEEWVKQKALKAGNLAFASMFVISVLAIIIQMLLTVDIRLVLGETATALVGGILYASIMVYNGIWDKCLPKSATIWRDFFTSVICAGIFTVIYGICLFRMGATETQVTRLAVGFLQRALLRQYPEGTSSPHIRYKPTAHVLHKVCISNCFLLILPSSYESASFLFVIGFSRHDPVSTVNLLQQNYTHQLVRKCHF